MTEAKDKRLERSSWPPERGRSPSASDLVTILVVSGVMALLWRFLD